MDTTFVSTFGFPPARSDLAREYLKYVNNIYSQFYFITLIVLIISIQLRPFWSISYLKVDKLREKVLEVHRIRAIQEELAGFLMAEVVDKDGEHYEEDVELYM